MNREIYTDPSDAMFRVMRRRIEIPSPTNSLIVKQLIPTDADDLYAAIDYDRVHMANHGETINILFPTRQSVYDWIVRPNERAKEVLKFGVWNIDQTLCGSLQLSPFLENSNMGYLSYFVGKRHINQGIASQAVSLVTDYAFDTFSFDSISGVIHQDNIASKKVLKNAGYTLCGGNEEKKLDWYMRRKPGMY